MTIALFNLHAILFNQLSSWTKIKNVIANEVKQLQGFDIASLGSQ